MNTNEIFQSPASMKLERAIRRYEQLEKELSESGGTIQTSALFDLDGNWVPAKIVEGKYGYSWLVLDSNGKSTGKFVPFASKKRDTQAKHGYVEGIVRVPAKVEFAGGFRPTALIVPIGENGTVKPSLIISTDRFTEVR